MYTIYAERDISINEHMYIKIYIYILFISYNLEGCCVPSVCVCAQITPLSLQTKYTYIYIYIYIYMCIYIYLSNRLYN